MMMMKWELGKEHLPPDQCASCQYIYLNINELKHKLNTMKQETYPKFWEEYIFTTEYLQSKPR